MRETFPTELLLQLLQATPEQLTAVERILGGHAFPDRQPSAPLANETLRSTRPKSPELDEESLGLAAKIFKLLTALDPDNCLRKAPPIKVFLLRFRQNLSRTEIARICGCDKSLVALRLKTIRDKLPWEPRQLREMSAHVEAMQNAVSDSRATSIYRKGAAYGDEDGGGESD